MTVEPITINGCEIEQKEEVKLLGVTFNSHMGFSEHVDNIICRTKPAFHTIIRLKKTRITPTNLVLFYKSRIVSILTYCSHSWYQNKTRASWAPTSVCHPTKYWLLWWATGIAKPVTYQCSAWHILHWLHWENQNQLRTSFTTLHPSCTKPSPSR